MPLDVIMLEAVLIVIKDIVKMIRDSIRSSTGKTKRSSSSRSPSQSRKRTVLVEV